MELMFQYFIFIKLIMAVLFVFSGYKAITKYVYAKPNERKWNGYTVLTVVLSLMLIYNPIKMDTNVQLTQQQANQSISAQKQLPPKVTDDSFKQSQQGLGITEKDMP
jgi:predicted membrane protein